MTGQDVPFLPFSPNGIITSSESKGHASGASQAIYLLMGRSAYLQVLSKNPLVIAHLPTSEFKRNDLIVTLDSARYLKFIELEVLGRNHTTVGDMDVARKVIDKIRIIQNIQ